MAPLRNSRIEVYYLLSMKSLKTYVVKVHDWMHIWFGSLMSIMCTYLLQHVNKTQVKIQSNVTMVIIVYMICMWLWASSCTSNFHYSHLNWQIVTLTIVFSVTWCFMPHCHLWYFTNDATCEYIFVMNYLQSLASLVHPTILLMKYCHGWLKFGWSIIS